MNILSAFRDYINSEELKPFLATLEFVFIIGYVLILFFLVLKKIKLEKFLTSKMNEDEKIFYKKIKGKIFTSEFVLIITLPILFLILLLKLNIITF